MKLLKLFLIGIIVVFLIYGCGGGSGGGSSSTSAIYKLFPDGYFSAGYQESYNLTGSNTAGGNFTGTYLLRTENPTTFNSEQAIPVTALLSITNTLNSASRTTTGTDYYSDNPNDRVLLGYEFKTLDLITSIGTSLSALPLRAKIGDSGKEGSYTYNNGDTETTHWQLDQADNGLAILTISSTTQDSSGNETTADESRYLIDKNGNRQSITIILTSDSGVIMTLSGPII
jgi:hypothetical protein